MNDSRVYLPAALLLPLVGTLLGCSGGEPRPDVQPVTGSLTINGQPAEGAILSFHPVDGQNFDRRGSRPRAIVEGDGTFTVSTYGDGDGAPAGQYAVSIVWLTNPESANPVDQLGGRFANPQQSEWRVQIEEGDNRLEPHRIDRVRLARGHQSGPKNSADPEE